MWTWACLNISAKESSHWEQMTFLRIYSSTCFQRCWKTSFQYQCFLPLAQAVWSLFDTRFPKRCVRKKPALNFRSSPRGRTNHQAPAAFWLCILRDQEPLADANPTPQKHAMPAEAFTCAERRKKTSAFHQILENPAVATAWVQRVQG